MTDDQAPVRKPKRVDANQPWVDAVTFALAECVRFPAILLEAAENRTLRDLPKDDFLYELRGVDGRTYTCGKAAHTRLEDAAADAHERSAIATTVSYAPVLKAIKQGIVERFIVQAKPVSLSAVTSVFTKAIHEVAKTRGDSRHLIPCQLMYVTDPDQFSVGPVTFYNKDAFRPMGEALVQEVRERWEKDGKRGLSDWVLDYYGNFSWVADVTIKGCDEKIGEERALQATHAALDFLHLLFGYGHSSKMVVGGSGEPSNRRGTIEVRGGSTRLSYSPGSTSAVGFQKGWAKMLNSLGSRQLVSAAGRAIEAITDPAMDRSLALRFIDAAAWHGQAVREASPAASIVKSVTALERLVSTGKSNDVLRVVSERSAAMCYNPAADEPFDAVLKRMQDIYDLRSRLAHGTLSPFDPEVRRRRWEVIKAVQDTLVNGLALLDQDKLFDRPLTSRQLKEGLESLVTWARRIDAVKRARSGNPAEASMADTAGGSAD